MRIFVFILALLGLGLAVASGVETLAFDASTTPNVGYVLYWGTNAAGRIASVALDTNRVVSLKTGPWGAFYFKVTAFNNSGIESDPSNVLLATNRPSAPLNLRLLPSTNSITLEGSEDLQSWQRLAIITPQSPPVLLAAQSRQMFRASTVAPPLPGFVAASAKPMKLHRQRGMQ